MTIISVILRNGFFSLELYRDTIAVSSAKVRSLSVSIKY